MAEVNWTYEAQTWLEEIFEYVAQENPNAAARIVTELFERAQLLAEHPEIGYQYEPSEREVRILLHRHYRLAYVIKEDGNIDILGVFHGSLDISRYKL